MPKLNETFWVIFKHCEAGFNLVNPVACCSVSRRTTATQTRLGRRPPLCVLPSKRLLLLCKILNNNTTGNTLWNSYITSSVILLKTLEKSGSFSIQPLKITEIGSFWVDKSSLKMPKMVHFDEFLKTWSLRSNSVTRQVNFHRTKIDNKCQNWKIKMRHFK